MAARRGEASIFGMGSSYEQAVSALYRMPHGAFVSERRRLASELKAEGDKVGAARLAKLERPPISAWAVNQLWWHAREPFDELFVTAEQLRAGDLSASAAHRRAIAKLEARAQQLLSESGHSANDATLRRIKMTLSGLAAAGSFEPDTPGALSKDREPPGFEAMGIAASPANVEDESERAEPAAAKSQRESEAAAAARERERQRRLEAEAAAERERQREREAAERRVRRKQLESAVLEAVAELAVWEKERDRIARDLAAAEREVERARAGVDAAQAALDADR